MQVRKTRAIGFRLKNSAAITGTATGYPIQSFVGNNQRGEWPVVRKSRARKSHAIGIDGEHGAISRTAATPRRPIKGIARQD
jgi:hypothetical protein